MMVARPTTPAVSNAGPWPGAGSCPRSDRPSRRAVADEADDPTDTAKDQQPDAGDLQGRTVVGELGEGNPASH